MGAGIHIGVDAQHHRHNPAKAAGNGGEHVELGRAFDVDLGNALGHREGQFTHGFADAGKDDVAGGNAGLAGAAQFALAHHIRTRATGGENPQHGEVVVGFDGVMHIGIQPTERILQRVQPGAHRLRRVNPGGGSKLGGDAGQRHAIEHEAGLRIHAQLRAGSDQLLDGGIGFVQGISRFGHRVSLRHARRRLNRKRCGIRSSIQSRPSARFSAARQPACPPACRL